MYCSAEEHVQAGGAQWQDRLFNSVRVACPEDDELSEVRKERDESPEPLLSCYEHKC